MQAAVDKTSLMGTAEKFADLLETKFYNSQRLPYSYLNKTTGQPFTPEEVNGYPLNFPGMPPREQWFSHENTPMVAGHHLSGLCQQAAFTKTAPQIARVFSSIQYLSTLSEEASEPGWLCKPYGGRASQESSCDQYGAILGGLRKLALLEDHPDSANANILAVRLVDYWIDHDYRCPFHRRPDHRWMGRHQWGLVTMAFVRLAYELTGDPKYARESERLCREEGCDRPNSRSGAFVFPADPQRPDHGLRKLSAFHHLVVEFLEILLSAWPERSAHWLALLEEFWTNDVRPGLNADGLLQATYLVDLRDNSWSVPSPQYCGSADIPQNWIGGSLSGSMSCFAAASAVRVGQAIPRLRDDCQRFAEQILTTINLDLVTLIIDPDGCQEHPAFGQIRTQMLDGRAPAQWLQAYWQGLSLGWWR